jgi:hypothetical protein
MKNLFLMGILMAMFGSATLAQATVLTFEDLSGNVTTPISDGYGGFNWNSAASVISITKDFHPGSGYQVGTIGNISVFNAYGSTPTNIDWADQNGTFTFNGAQFTSAWYDQQLTFKGYKDGNELYSQTYSISTVTPLLIELDWFGIDRLQINSTNAHWDMDNFTFNGSAPVPEPSTFLLLGAGLLGAGLLRKKLKC